MLLPLSALVDGRWSVRIRGKANAEVRNVGKLLAYPCQIEWGWDKTTSRAETSVNSSMR
jgi:hypothetical protein